MQVFENQRVRNVMFLGGLCMLIGFLTEGPLLEFLSESAHRDGKPLSNLAWMYDINWFGFLNLLKAAGFVMVIWAIFSGISTTREEEIRWAWITLGVAINILIATNVVASNFIRFYNGFEGVFIFFATLGFLALAGAAFWLGWFYMKPGTVLKASKFRKSSSILRNTL